MKIALSKVYKILTISLLVVKAGEPVFMTPQNWGI